MRARGVSLLLEILVGLGLFAVAILLVMGLFPTAARSLSQAKDQSQATNLARDVMETQLQHRYPGAPVGPTEVVCYGMNKGQATEERFTYSVDIADVAGTTPGFPVRDIVVRVEWKTGGLPHKVVLETYRGPFE